MSSLREWEGREGLCVDSSRECGESNECMMYMTLYLWRWQKSFHG